VKTVIDLSGKHPHVFITRGVVAVGGEAGAVKRGFTQRGL
jgi:hypothetical protein